MHLPIGRYPQLRILRLLRCLDLDDAGLRCQRRCAVCQMLFRHACSPPFSSRSGVLDCCIRPTVILFSMMHCQIFSAPFGYCMVTQCNDPCCLISGRQSIPMISYPGKVCCKMCAASRSLSGWLYVGYKMA